MIKNRSLPIIFSVFLVSSFVIGQEKETAAVLDFDGYGISKMEAITLTQRLASNLVQTDAYIIVERGMMQDILKEQGFQQTGCTSAECAVEVGAMLGVQKMISGSFGKLGSTYTIEAKVFSVQSGKVVNAVSKTYKGEIDGLLEQVEQIAWELANKKSPLKNFTDAVQDPKAVAPSKPRYEQPLEKTIKKKGSKRWLLWTTILVSAGGGAAYFYLQSLEEEQGTELPLPPPPPSGRVSSFR